MQCDILLKLAASFNDETDQKIFSCQVSLTVYMNPLTVMVLFNYPGCGLLLQVNRGEYESLCI